MPASPEPGPARTLVPIPAPVPGLTTAHAAHVPDAASADDDEGRASPDSAAPDVTPPSDPDAITAASASTTGPLTLALQGEGVADYLLRTANAHGTATLHWRVDHERYDLTLDREAGGRRWPTWSSEGRIVAAGLEPERHRVSRSTRVRELLSFEHTDGALVLHSGATRTPAPPATQDRLSWWLQIGAMLSAVAEGSATGRVVRIPVAHAGGVRWWDFEILQRDGMRWQLRRHVPRDAGRPSLTWTLCWIVPAALPHDIRFDVDGELQWSLTLQSPPQSASECASKSPSQPP